MNVEVNKNVVRRYLLGALSAEQQDALEAEYFADNETFEQVWAVENELVDEYVRGRLANNERTLFERNYLSTPKHQERVAVARQLLQAADDTIVEERSVSSAFSGWSNLLAFFQTPQFAWGGAMALLLLAVGAWWYFRSVNSVQDQIAQASPSPVYSPPASPASTAITSSPTTSPTTASSASPKPTAATQSSIPAVLAFALVGTGARAPDEGEMQKLTIPNGTKQVRLQMKVGDEQYPRYQVRVRNLEGKEVLRQSTVSPSADKKSVAVLISSLKLSPGDYVVTLSGVSQTGEPEEINKFFFRVLKK